MAEFTLPKNSKITAGKHHPAKVGAKQVRKFKVYRWRPGRRRADLAVISVYSRIRVQIYLFKRRNAGGGGIVRRVIYRNGYMSRRAAC